MAEEQISTKASEEELKSLKEHFKNVEFHEYPLLIDDCKRHIIGFLDSMALIQLGMCSKNEKRLADEFPVKIDEIKFACYEEKQKGVNVRVKIDGDREYEVAFKEDEPEALINIGRGLMSVWKKLEDVYYKEAVAFLEYLLKKCHYGVTNIELDMEKEASKWATRDGSPVEHLLNLRDVQLGKMRSKYQKWWLQKMPDTLTALTIESKVSSEVVQLPSFLNARYLYCNKRCHITDDQLLALNAVDVYIHRAPHITVRGLNAFLRKLQFGGGGGVDGFERLAIGKVEMRAEVLLDGLNAVKINSARFSGSMYSIQSKVRPTERITVALRGGVSISLSRRPKPPPSSNP